MRAVKGELRVTWHFCSDECVGSDTWRQVCCHQRGDVRFGKSAVLQKGTKIFASVQTWWSLTKRSKFVLSMLWLLFGQRLLLNKTFPVHMIFTFYWDISAPTGVEEYKSDLIRIKPYNPKSNKSPECCCHQDPLTFSATEKTEHHSHGETRLFAGGTSHLSQSSSHECHTASTLTQNPLTPSSLAQSLLPGPPQSLWLCRMQRSEITVLNFEEWPADGNNQIKSVTITEEERSLIKFSWETRELRKTFLSGAVQPLLQTFTQRNEATAQPTCLSEGSQRHVKAGWERHILCHCTYRSPWRRSAKQLSRISPGKPACASKVSEAQKACRTGLLVLVRLAKEKQGEVKESTVLSWCFGGQEQGQVYGRGSQPFLPLWESMVWEHGTIQGRARQRDWWDFSMDPQKSMSM